MPCTPYSVWDTYMFHIHAAIVAVVVSSAKYTCGVQSRVSTRRLRSCLGASRWLGCDCVGGEWCVGLACACTTVSDFKPSPNKATYSLRCASNGHRDTTTLLSAPSTRSRPRHGREKSRIRCSFHICDAADARNKMITDAHQRDGRTRDW